MSSRSPRAIAVPHTPEAARRLEGIRRLSWLLDRSIPIGGGRRIGIDPIIGLIPGVGDWLGAAISLWLIFQAIRMGLPLSVLGRMGINVAIEATLGAIPVLGDLFDAAWQANHRNLRLVERHYDPRREPRSLRSVIVPFAIVVVLFLLAVAALAAFVLRLFWRLLEV
jgi:hypothetical protein